MSPLFEVWDPDSGGQWRWAGTGQDRAGAVQIIGYFRAYTGLPEESFQIRRVRPARGLL